MKVNAYQLRPIEEIAGITGISACAIYKWINRGKSRKIYEKLKTQPVFWDARWRHVISLKELEIFLSDYDGNNKTCTEQYAKVWDACND